MGGWVTGRAMIASATTFLFMSFVEFFGVFGSLWRNGKEGRIRRSVALRPWLQGDLVLQFVSLRRRQRINFVDDFWNRW